MGKTMSKRDAYRTMFRNYPDRLRAAAGQKVRGKGRAGVGRAVDGRRHGCDRGPVCAAGGDRHLDLGF